MGRERCRGGGERDRMCVMREIVLEVYTEEEEEEEEKEKESGIGTDRRRRRGEISLSLSLSLHMMIFGSRTDSLISLWGRTIAPFSEI